VAYGSTPVPANGDCQAQQARSEEDRAERLGDDSGRAIHHDIECGGVGLG
jgi:hypothetical protein